MNTVPEPLAAFPLAATGTGIDVEICDMQAHLRVDREGLRRLARGVLAGEGIDRAAISIALVDDATILELNNRHLGHDWPTDVISFTLSDGGDAELAGELVVSCEMAAATAREADTDPQAELALYVVHGLLHLCGFDDTTDAKAAAMRRREGEVLAREGFTNPYSLVGSTQPQTRVTGRESVR